LQNGSPPVRNLGVPPKWVGPGSWDPTNAIVSQGGGGEEGVKPPKTKGNCNGKPPFLVGDTSTQMVDFELLCLFTGGYTPQM